MAMKKAARKGDEPVRVGRAKEQTTKGFIRDPYGYQDKAYARQSVSYNKETKSLYRPKKDTLAQQRGKAATKEAKELVAYAKKKYGTKFVVEINDDGVANLIAGASKKQQKVQSARMTAQAKAAKKKK